jgi:uroporphyrinogen III methyltransferase/synthase
MTAPSPGVTASPSSDPMTSNVFTAVVTRPAGQSSELIARLSAEGIDTLEFPLIEIAPVEDDAPLLAALAALDRYALVVFVSPNAIDHAFAKYNAIWPHALPIGVVGPGSVAALARHGVVAPEHRIVSPPSSDHDDDARFDSEALYAGLEAQLGENAFDGKQVLIVRGDGGRGWLAERLREAGAQVDTVAAYRRLVPDPPIGDWARVHALLAGAPHAWLVTSSEGVRNLDSLAHAHLTAAETTTLKHAPLVAPHSRIAETARGLGFDCITMSGAGDERIVRALAACAESLRPSPTPDTSIPPPASLNQLASINPVPTRMSDPKDTDNVPPKPTKSAAPLPPNPPLAPSAPREAHKRGGMGIALLWFVVVVFFAAAGVGGFALNRKVERIEAKLVQRQQTIEAQTAEWRVKTDQALATVRGVDARFLQLEGKLAEAQSSQQALQQQYADLAHNRDDWMLAEVAQILSSASEQLQLTGNTELALFALQSVDTRLAASTSSQAVAVRKALAHDIDKLKAAPSTDLTGLAIKLDNAIAQVDALPLSGEALVKHAVPPANASALAASAIAGEPRWKLWWRDFSAGLGQQLKSLVQVRRIDHADAMLNSPEQGHFIRENVKLRLLSARLSLLSRNPVTLRSDLAAVDAALARYFDASSKQTQNVRELVKVVEQDSTAVEIPNIDVSLQAVHAYKSRG